MPAEAPAASLSSTLRARSRAPPAQRLTCRPQFSLQGPLSVVAHNRKVVGALSVVGATESQIGNNFLENFAKSQQNLWISDNNLQFAEIPEKFR